MKDLLAEKRDSVKESCGISRTSIGRMKRNDIVMENGELGSGVGTTLAFSHSCFLGVDCYAYVPQPADEVADFRQ